MGGTALDEATAIASGAVPEGVGGGASGPLRVQESASPVNVTPSALVMLLMGSIVAWRRGGRGSHLLGGALSRSKDACHSRVAPMADRTKSTPKSRAPRAAKQAPSAGLERAPRERMVLAAAALLSERGLAGTSFSEVIERSGAPRGSIYHHFPEGKDRLTAEAIALVGNHLLALLRLRDGATPGQVLHRFLGAWRAVLVGSDCKAGCAIAAVANERLEHPELGARAAAVFLAWEHELVEALAAAGMPRAKADSAAVLILAAVEGALILCRARSELAPLEAVGEALAAFVGP